MRRSGIDQSHKCDESLGAKRFRFVKAVFGERGIVRALGVLNKYKVPIELRVAGQGTNLRQLLVGVLSAFHRCGQLIRQVCQLVADGVGALLGLCLDAGDEHGQLRLNGAVVAERTGSRDELLIFQRTREIVAVCHSAVFGCLLGLPISFYLSNNFKLNKYYNMLIALTFVDAVQIGLIFFLWHEYRYDIPMVPLFTLLGTFYISFVEVKSIVEPSNVKEKKAQEDFIRILREIAKNQDLKDRVLAVLDNKENQEHYETE